MRFFRVCVEVMRWLKWAGWRSWWAWVIRSGGVMRFSGVRTLRVLSRDLLGEGSGPRFLRGCPPEALDDELGRVKAYPAKKIGDICGRFSVVLWRGRLAPESGRFL